MEDRVKRGGRAPPPHQAGFFTIVMESTPESAHCHSVYSVVTPDPPKPLSAEGTATKRSITQRLHHKT
jgi:hypothetical protein